MLARPTGARPGTGETVPADQDRTYKLNRPSYGVPNGPGLNRPLQTHLVMDGKFKHSAYLDEGTTGPILRSLSDGRTLARMMPSGRWSRPVREAAERPKRGTDLIKPRGPAVVVQLTKGEFY